MMGVPSDKELERIRENSARFPNGTPCELDRTLLIAKLDQLEEELEEVHAVSASLLDMDNAELDNLREYVNWIATENCPSLRMAIERAKELMGGLDAEGAPTNP